MEMSTELPMATPRHENMKKLARHRRKVGADSRSNYIMLGLKVYRPVKTPETAKWSSYCDDTIYGGPGPDSATVFGTQVDVSIMTKHAGAYVYPMKDDGTPAGWTEKWSKHGEIKGDKKTEECWNPMKRETPKKDTRTEGEMELEDDLGSSVTLHTFKSIKVAVAVLNALHRRYTELVNWSCIVTDGEPEVHRIVLDGKCRWGTFLGAQAWIQGVVDVFRDPDLMACPKTEKKVEERV